MCIYVFRHAGGLLIEWPDLDVPPAANGERWVATLWPDPLALDGWAADEWQPANRGWIIPDHLAIGDVLEFGVDYTSETSGPGKRVWYGWLRYATDVALVVEGPYDDPGRALTAADTTTAEVRWAQLASEASGSTPSSR